MGRALCRAHGHGAAWERLRGLSSGRVRLQLPAAGTIAGRIVNLAGDTVRVQTNMLAPSSLTAVDRKLIEEIVPSKVSMMPAGLLNTLTKTEILDLMAYLLSRGDPQHKMFQSP